MNGRITKARRRFAWVFACSMWKPNREMVMDAAQYFYLNKLPN